jgi:hypothetical protein
MEFSSFKVRNPSELSRINVTIRAVEGIPRSWRAEINDFSHLLSLLTPFLKGEMYSMKNPFIDNRLSLYFT